MITRKLTSPSITYRIAIRPRADQKVFTLQTVPAQGEGEGRNGAAQAGRFSRHTCLDIQCGQRAKLERLCRYVSRPPVAVERLALTPSGQVRYALKTPYRNGTTHLVLEPLVDEGGWVCSTITRSHRRAPADVRDASHPAPIRRARRDAGRFDRG